MFPKIDTGNAEAVQEAVGALYLEMYPDGDPEFVPRAFQWVIDCFEGRYPGYCRIDARYHDLEHTMQGTLCMTRLLHGRFRSGTEPVLSRHRFELGLRAILLHDTGYLKRRDDVEGTGAKYTAVHVHRSAGFAERILTERGFSGDDVWAVQNMIHCTGVEANLSRVPFQNAEERLVGMALGTADLLGQMAAADYVEKLPILYSEFCEARRHGNGLPKGMAQFTSAEDLLQKSPAFWSSYVQPKLERDFEGVYRFLNQPHPDGPNEYVDRIEANMERLRKRFQMSSAV